MSGLGSRSRSLHKAHIQSGAKMPSGAASNTL